MAITKTLDTSKPYYYVRYNNTYANWGQSSITLGSASSGGVNYYRIVCYPFTVPENGMNRLRFSFRCFNFKIDKTTLINNLGFQITTNQIPPTPGTSTSLGGIKEQTSDTDYTYLISDWTTTSLKPGQYYLWIFPKEYLSGYYCEVSSVYEAQIEYMNCGINIYTSSTWKKAIPWIYTNGSWKQAIPWIYTKNSDETYSWKNTC